MPAGILCKKNCRILFNDRDKDQSLKYYRFSFEIPAAISSIIIKIDYHSVFHAQLPLVLFDPAGNIRLINVGEGTKGFFTNRISVGSEKESGPGVIPGPVQPGEWHLLIYKRRFTEDLDCTLEICIEPEDRGKKSEHPVSVPLKDLVFNHRVFNKNPGWYNGELHVHSNESTGRTPVQEIYHAAAEAHLDFLTLTDHFSASHWLRLEELGNLGPPLLLKSMEVAGDYGHANVHGLEDWLNPFVDDNADLTAFLSLEEVPTMERIADAVHSQGGLFCINHPQSGLVSWRYHNFPWEKADLMEVWCLPDGIGTFLYPVLWDGLLCRGLHITAVGSSDSHHPTNEGPWKLGQIRNWVYARELSQPAILAGLRKGAAYISCGPFRLRFEAQSGDGLYGMGDTVTLDGGRQCTFSIEIDGPDSVSGNLFIFTDGLIYDIIYFGLDNAGTKKYQFTVDAGAVHNRLTGTSYFRIEFHEELVKAQYYGMAYRDHKSMRIISNPIWIQRAIRK
jgi:hypothetical protein